VQFALLKWLERSAAEDRQGGMLCRLIVSSSQSLPALLGKEGFRSDLLHAISVYQISMPSLAERVDDRAIICEDMVTRVCLARGLRRPSLTRIAMEAIQDYPWRGNFSELRSILEHAVTHTRDGIIGSGDLPLLPAVEELQRLGSASIDAVTKASLIVALEDCKGNRRRAAQRLKVSIRTVYNMIDRYQLNANRQGSAPDQN
jgi:DNA-binding NtrC family response regulator